MCCYNVDSKVTAQVRHTNMCMTMLPRKLFSSGLKLLLNHNNRMMHLRSYACTFFIKGLSEKIETLCAPLEVTPVCRPMRTLKRGLMQVQTRTPEQKQTGVVYEATCKGLLRGVCV